MVKAKKRFNWKARQSSESVSHDPSAKSEMNVEVDINIREEKYDSSNPFILPTGNEKQKIANSVAKPVQKKPLSRKQKRRLQNVLDKKNRKINREELLEKLHKVQASNEELELLTSTSSMHTLGIKRSAAQSSKPKRISSIKGINKKSTVQPQKKIKRDPNVVGSNSTSESECGESDIEVPKNDSTCVMLEDLPSEKAELQIVPPVADVHKSDEEMPNKAGTSAELPEIQIVDEPVKKPREPAIFVPVHRSPEIQAVREALPIYSEEQAIMEAIRENDVVVIHGATGSGKTTQVPQFLYEAGYTKDNCLIGITEPRRIAAIQMASRVAEEMNLPEAVSYHIRYEKTATDDKTEIKFMTDGVLLKEIRHDFLLRRYSVIIIDEAHERSVFSDVLIGLLSRILPLRIKKGYPLKLIIMSATLRVEDFTENPRLFKKKPCLLTIDSRQYDVVLHFNPKTPSDYVQAAYDKVCKIHQQLPSGAILVFLTGEKEVTRLCKLLRKTFPLKMDNQVQEEVENDGNKVVTTNTAAPKSQRKRKADGSFSELAPKIDLDEYSTEPLDNEEMQHQISDDELPSDDESDVKLMDISVREPLYVLPLYSVLPTQEQAKIFKPPPQGCRLCVVSTNVSETSVTIPGLKYVVDSGKVKSRVYDKIACGVSTFAINWTSKASANQRAGRAGRTEGGHCYRLYSSAVFEHEFPDFTAPDIKRIPVDDVLLQMKAMGIDRVVNFPFPTPPDVESLKAAEKRLVKLGALQDLSKEVQRYKDIAQWEYSAKVTPMGKAMARFPLSPRFAKMLILSYNNHVMPYIIAIVSAMTVPEVFLASEPPTGQGTNAGKDNETEEKEPLWSGIKKIGTGQGKSANLGDVMVLVRAVGIYEQSRNQARFCSKFHIRLKAMLEIHKMRLQLIREVNRAFSDVELPLDLTLESPADGTVETLRKILACCLTDHVARRIPDGELLKYETPLKGAYKCLDLDEPVYIHPSSVLAKQLPEYVAYQDVFRTSRFFMRTVIEIEPEWLAGFAADQCVFSSPLEDPPPFYDKTTDKIMCSLTSTFGVYQWDLPTVVMPMPDGVLKYRWFCFFFLEGQICPMLKPFKQHLLSNASTMLKQWANLMSMTRRLLQAVLDKQVDSKESLFKRWDEDPSYLLTEYCEWIPQAKHIEISGKWPPRKNRN